MKFATKIGLCMLAMSLSVVGCADANKPAAPKDKAAATDAGKQAAPKKETHSHGSGPNGGVVFDLGKHHAEFTVDHPKKEVTVLFIEGSVAAKELTLTTKETKISEGADKGKAVAPMTVTLKPVDEKDGKATKFVGSDPGVGNVADFAGSVVGEIDGKPSQGEFTE